MQNQQEFPQNVINALALPKADYKNFDAWRLTPQFDPSRIALIDMEAVGITNATSDYPVIGTEGFNPCTCMIIYNKATRKVALSHHARPSADQLEEMLQDIGAYGEQQPLIHIYIMGASPFSETEEHPSLPPEGCKQENINTKMLMEELCSFLEIAQEKNSNISLKAFDMWDKEKPYSVLFDARNGSIIAASPMITKERDAMKEYPLKPYKAAILQCDPDERLDATLKEYQRDSPSRDY